MTITGEITHTNDVYLEPVSVPEDIQTAAYYGALEVSGTTDLATGSYRYDSIALDNDGILNINGDVKIYLTSNTSALTTGNNTVAVNIIDGGSVVIYTDGAVDLGNKVIINNNNINPKPADFMIFSRYAGENGVVIDNSNTFYGAIYAPQTSVELSNNAAFFGSVIGGTLDIVNNGALHYDEALAQVGAPWQPASLRDWQETFD